MSNIIFILILAMVALDGIIAPPVDPKKDKEAAKKTEELDDFGLEYGRYLQQVVQALEEDKEFAKKLENISAEQIRSGHIAKELEFVKHNVRSKLHELKRIEVDRLRKLIQAQMERTELGLYRDEEGHLLNSPDGRRWRTVPSHKGGFEGGVGDGNFWLGLNRKDVKIPKHLNVENPRFFEIEDLKKLIQTATNDLEELDKQRKEQFKKYELEKEASYQESLKNLTGEQREEKEKHHQELIEKHKDHPKIHHPGSKPQLEQVWEDQDHMPKEEFNPRTFFAMHDVNGDGHLDVEEIEAILIPEVKKMYNPNNEEDDPAEMEEEFHRMREHIFNETDKNKDSLISLEEFMKMTEQQDFQEDDGWKGLDEQQVYSQSEFDEYMRQRQMHPQDYYGDQRMFYDVANAPQYGIPPQINYQGGMPQHPPYQQGQQFGASHQQGHPDQFQQGHPQQFQQGYPQQGHQQQGHQQQFQQGHQQQGHPQQFQQGHPQQFQQGHPQQFQQGHPQQIQQGHPQQIQQGHPQQIQQGHPQQIQQGHPQQIQQGHPQQIQQGHPQQLQQGQLQQGNPQQGQPQQVQQGQFHQQQPLSSGNPQSKPEHTGQQPAIPVVANEQVKLSNSVNQVPHSAENPNKVQDTAGHASSNSQAQYKNV